MIVPRITAIDPGPALSAWVDFVDGRPVAFGHSPNPVVRGMLERRPNVVIEMIASYGMGVGAEVFETCLWIGRFDQVCGGAQLIPRMRVKMHLCQRSTAKDGNVRLAIIDRYGGQERAVGKKKSPGPLYGVSGDVWQALGLAIYAADTWL